MTAWEIVFTVLAIIAVILVVLYFIGRKLQKRQDEASVQIEQNKQTVQALIIDKKKMKLKDANYPAAALEQVPWYMRNNKFPMAKVRIGNQIATLICEPSIFAALPVKSSVKIPIAGSYITGFSTAKKGDKKGSDVPLSKKEKRAKARAAKKEKREAERAAKKAARAAK